MLGRAGLRIEEEAEIVVLPPELMADNLERGRIDGFCAGEPWNSLAIEAGTGFCVATSDELCCGHPEKIFLIPHRLAESRPEEHLLMIGALSEAGRICDDPEHRTEVIRLLASRPYLDVEKSLIANSLGESFHRGFGQYAAGESIHTFSGEAVNRPTPDKANLIISQLRDCGLIPSPSLPASPLLGEIFRPDLYDEACNPATAPAIPTPTH